MGRDASSAAYERHRQRAAERIRAISLRGRDIGPIPKILHPRRRRRCERDFRAFCERYLPGTFSLPWSRDHLSVIALIQRAILEGGLFAMAMPRGSGKSVLCQAAVIWALLYGHREFVALVAATEYDAQKSLAAIKAELESNDALLADFPEVCYPIRRLDRITSRCAGQLCEGQPTRMTWTVEEVTLPAIRGSRASGATVRVAGITGRIRGMRHTRADGRVIRPSLAIIDDPQTDESARSPAQTAAREAIISGAILGLAGPGRKIAAIMPCTVIAPGDLADSLLDRARHPEWQGLRCRMVYSWPERQDLWDQYAEIRADGLRRGQGIAPATEFYRQNREAMDKGAVVAWPERYNEDELSAIQHAVNLRLRDPDAFASEYQNEPVVPHEAARGLDEHCLDGRVLPIERGHVPGHCERLTAFIDVHERVLAWMVVGWTSRFGGAIVDYGAYPSQRRWWTAANATPSLAQAARVTSREAAIYAGLDALCRIILGREYPREDGQPMRVERCLIDANWGLVTDTVYQFCRAGEFAPITLPSHGRFVGAGGRPIESAARPGEPCGPGWRMPAGGSRRQRFVLFDANRFKSLLLARLQTAVGDPSSLAVCGGDVSDHQQLIDHLTAEEPVTVEAGGQVADEWRRKPGRSENHWWDCLVGAAVAAATIGLSVHGPSAQARARRRVALSAIAERRATQQPGRRR